MLRSLGCRAMRPTPDECALSFVHMPRTSDK